MSRVISNEHLKYSSIPSHTCRSVDIKSFDHVRFESVLRKFKSLFGNGTDVQIIGDYRFEVTFINGNIQHHVFYDLSKCRLNIFTISNHSVVKS